MTDGDALLAAILAYPDEGTPRLVYADWLEENGQPERAELIRVQIALAVPGALDRDRLFRRERELVEQFALAGAAWCPVGWTVFRWAPEETVRPFNPFNNPAAFVHRGFVRHIRCALAVFCRDAAALFAAHPVETVDLLGAFAGERGGGFEYVLPVPYPTPPTEEARRFHATRRTPSVHARAEDAHAELSVRCVTFGRAEAAQLRSSSLR